MIISEQAHATFKKDIVISRFKLRFAQFCIYILNTLITWELTHLVLTFVQQRMHALVNVFKVSSKVIKK